MTDHNYPDNLEGCYSMLKKRDAIIEQLQAESQPGVDTENLRLEFDKTLEENSGLIESRDHWEQMTISANEDAKKAAEERDRMFSELSIYKIKNGDLKKEIDKLTAEVADYHKLQADLKEQLEIANDKKTDK